MNYSFAARSARALFVCLLAGCVTYPETSESFDEGVVATVYDRTKNFSAYATFTVPEQVVVAEVADDGTISMGMLEPSASSAIITKIADELKARGYTQVSSTQSPDLGLAVGAVSGSVDGVVAGGYMGGYYPYYWGVYGYSYYYPYAYSYSYKTGSLVIDLVDLKLVQTQPPVQPGNEPVRQLPAIWGAVAYKAIASEGNVTPTNVSDAIEQAFAQSPYLRR